MQLRRGRLASHSVLPFAPTVERRRRDKINNWIVQLSKIIPDCSMESTKSGQSKGGILSKACDYIQELRQSNHRLSEELQGLDQLQLDNDVLRQQVRVTPSQPPWQPCSHWRSLDSLENTSHCPSQPWLWG